ncbi:MAG: hypothetical protein ACP5FH_09135, partial [Terracidiphilus sp.]
MSAAALEPMPAPQRMAVRRRWIVLLWTVSLISLGGMAVVGPIGNDVSPYWSAIRSVECGSSPYAGSIAALSAYHNRPAGAAGGHALAFWYPPLTIPLLRTLTLLPVWLLGALYFGALAAAFLLQLRAGYLMASEKDRGWLVFLLPFAAFFPGLLADESILYGNLAYLLYGLILTAAVPGWKENKWLWFYLAVVFASIFKPPMMTLLAFPVLTGRRQWAPASAAGAAGCLLFAVQPFIWPDRFREFLLTGHLVAGWTHDFGFSPCGVLSQTLCAMKKPYSPANILFYLAWATALAALMLAIRHEVHRHPHLREIWVPLALVGAVLLNPRIKEYDTAPLTVPMLLIAWHALRQGQEWMAQWRAKHAFGPACQNREQAAPRTRRGNAPWPQLILLGFGCFAACNLIDILW